MKLVYIAGAFRGKNAWEVAQNVHAAKRAGFDVGMIGGFPVIPQANGSDFDGTFTDEFWIEGTKALMRQCHAVYIFNREHLTVSSGTKGEFDDAHERGLPVFFRLSELEAWLEANP